MERFQKIELILLFFILLVNLILFVSVAERGFTGFSVFGNSEAEQPFNHIDEGEISADSEQVVIKVENAILTKYENTNSMNPVLGFTANGVEIKPESEDQIYVGDIITFKQDDKFIIHRVIEKSIDEKGVYFITKGDNTLFNDEKIRFEDIESVLIAIIY